MTVARTLFDGHTSQIPQLTLARFMEGGHYGAHVRSMRTVYADRLNVLVSAVQAKLGAFVEPHPPIGGLQMSCFLTGSITEGVAVDGARRAGVEVRSLSELHTATRPRPGLLMGFAAYTPNEIDVATSRLAASFKRGGR